ncbi:flagellar hook capping FlgD N-terminal domain-containing protein [Aestuariivita sp.]|jgi:flagellar basal-body rod modification protein FlgD|uniref:flagellar hook capping FlgD N-terminal domain-containing protein n=1 Tax=Aestuariivita sp. TaxID=1872407 RepID=UPI0021736D4D|nr:flagellar hook capping FlgD N-terminal domain-containing protein [Aestuariivita sp.]MCE8006484.1 flagellar hook assembly protein FlgD [Aestuariivita sp.]
MTTVSPATAAANAAAATQSPAASSAAVLSSDFETFLQMLTAQAKYQDPLEPVSSSEYAAQLAQFSMVEQQVFTNDQLALLAGAIGGNAMTTMANWVGMEARAVASVAFNGQPITIAPNPASAANRVEMVVYDESGTEVARRELPVSAENYEWDGRDQTGAEVSSGTYSFAIESIVDGEVILAEPAEVYARVIEAQIVGADTVLKLQGGTYVLSDRVTALREPPA